MCRVRFHKVCQGTITGKEQLPGNYKLNNYQGSPEQGAIQYPANVERETS